MNRKTLSVIGLVAGAWALFIGIWGVVDNGGSAETQADVEEGFLWLAIAVISLAVSAIASALSARRDR